eukprot:6712728-Prymnesium_polylepis.1
MAFRLREDKFRCAFESNAQRNLSSLSRKAICDTSMRATYRTHTRGRDTAFTRTNSRTVRFP